VLSAEVAVNRNRDEQIEVCSEARAPEPQLPQIASYILFVQENQDPHQCLTLRSSLEPTAGAA